MRCHTYLRGTVGGQTGAVVGLHLKVDVENEGGDIEHAVDSALLGHVRSFRIGHFVVHGNWLGRIDR